VIVTTNLPFSEWSQVIPNPRLCKALIDRLTDQAHIITTGTDSYRFRRTSARKRKPMATYRIGCLAVRLFRPDVSGLMSMIG